MPFRGFGYTVEDAGNPERLASELEAVIEAGYTHAEIDPQHWDVFHGGRLVRANLERFAPVATRYRDRLGYAMHGPFHVNLFDLGEIARSERTLLAGIEVAAALGAGVMVYHPGTRLKPPAQAGVAMDELLEREREVLRRVAEAGARDGVEIAVEVYPPYSEWEYTYAVWPERLVQQVAAIDHLGVGVCIDFGHLYLSARWYGFDVVAGAATLAPWTNHFHVQDLFGIFAGGEDNAERGEGDLHLPPGWGEIPFGAIFAAVDFPRAPIFNVELWGSRFLPHARAIRQEIERLAALRSPATVAGEA
jgi:sugar phosphate isomerase/epimerase